MSAYEIPFIRKVKEVRDEEMHGATRFFTMMIINIALSNTASFFCSVAVLGAYALMVQHDPSNGTFDTTTIFTIVTTVQLLGLPLVGQALPSLFTGWASFKRIEAYLSLAEKPETPVEGTLAHRPELCNYDFKVSQGSFAWERNGTPVLKDVDFTLETGRLYMCVGPVASGKTSLVASMLGETTLLSGSLLTSPKRPNVGYAAQDAFIFSGTIRENITLGDAIDHDRYQAVVAACGLGPDFARFPAGDMTRLADKGASLSGGQKQRVALARAIYSNTPVLFLDDPLSALDAATEEHVARSLFDRSELLKGRTIFITTHSVHHLPSADTVVVMNEGSIVFQGTYAALQNESSLLHLVQESSRSQISAENLNPDPANSNDKPINGQAAEEQDDETMQSYNQKGWHPYIFWARTAGLHRVASSLSIAISWTLLAVMMNLYIKAWSENSGHVALWILGYCTLSALYLVVGIMAFWHWMKCSNIFASTKIHEDQVKAVVSAAPSYLQATPVGRLTNRFSQDISTIVMGFPMSFIAMFLTAGSLVFNLIFVLFALTPWSDTVVDSVPAVSSDGLLAFDQVLSRDINPVAATRIRQHKPSAIFVWDHYIRARNDPVRRLKPFRVSKLKSRSAVFSVCWDASAVSRKARTVLAFMTMIIAVGMTSLAVGLRTSTSAGLLGIALGSLTKIAMFSSNLLM
ncbi:hypothetical protein FRC10_012013, partial [Ceratobasidium sp. 414]